MRMILALEKNPIVWLLIAGVALVFLSPCASLEPTALRAARLASLVLTSVATSAGAVIALSIPAGSFQLTLSHQPATQPIDIIELDCVRLC